MSAIDGVRWTNESAQKFLARGRWFGSLSPDMQERIVASSEIVHFAGGVNLFKIGEPASGLYATLIGDVRAYAYGDNNERIFLRAVGPGSWFGDAPLLDDSGMRTFEVTAVSQAWLLFLPTETYRELTADVAVYRAFVQLSCIHMRHAIRVLVETRSDARVRAARALLRLSRAHGTQTAEGTRLGMNLSQADLASLVGVSRQYMNELITRWEDEDVLRWNGKSHPLLKIEQLRSHVGPLDKWIEETDDWI